MERLGPRIGYVGLLTYWDHVVGEPGLTIPNRRLQNSAFMLTPQAETAPGTMMG